MYLKISEQSSTDKHIEVAKQHVSDCNRVKDCETYAVKMSLAIEVLQGIRFAITALDAKKKSCYNNTILTYADLDIEIRNTFEACKSFDKNNNTSILSEIFPENKNTNKFKAAIFAEVGSASKIVDRLKDLGSDHPLAILVHPLQKTERKHKTAIKEHKVAITEWDTIIEQEKVAQADLRLQYENNYLEISSLFDNKVVNQIFPNSVMNLNYQPSQRVVAQF